MSQQLAIFYIVLISTEALGNAGNASLLEEIRAKEDDYDNTHYGHLLSKQQHFWEYRCGLSLVSSRIVLSTAFCFTSLRDDFGAGKRNRVICLKEDFLPPENFLVVLNVTGDDPLKSSLLSYKVHPKVTRNCLIYNVALGYLKEDVPVGHMHGIRPTDLPISRDLDGERNCKYTGLSTTTQKGRLIGLGAALLGYVIKVIIVHVVPKVLSALMKEFRKSATCQKKPLCQIMFQLCDATSALCADPGTITRANEESKGCVYDSGSSLVCDGRLAGLLQPGGSHCDGFPVFVKTSLHARWIKETVETLNSTRVLAPFKLVCLTFLAINYINKLLF